MNICISCCTVSSEFVKKRRGGNKCNEKLKKEGKKNKQKRGQAFY